MTDPQTGLRDRIAAAMRPHYHCTGDAEQDVIPCACGWLDPGPDATRQTDWDAHIADAVLAVLPPADRAAVYAEVADRLAADAEQGDKEGFTRIYRRSAAKQVREWGEELRRLAAEAQQQPEGETPASTAPLAAGLPLVQGNCPACHQASLFLGNGGYVTCARLDCPEPDAATAVLEQPAKADTGEEAEA